MFDWFVARLMADCPFSLSLELTELVTLPGIFFLEMTCLAELVVAVLPDLFTLPPAPLTLLELYLLFRPTSRFTLELEWPEY